MHFKKARDSRLIFIEFLQKPGKEHKSKLMLNGYPLN